MMNPFFPRVEGDAGELPVEQQVHKNRDRTGSGGDERHHQLFTRSRVFVRVRPGVEKPWKIPYPSDR